MQGKKEGVCVRVWERQRTGMHGVCVVVVVA